MELIYYANAVTVAVDKTTLTAPSFRRFTMRQLSQHGSEFQCSLCELSTSDLWTGAAGQMDSDWIKLICGNTSGTTYTNGVTRALIHSYLLRRRDTAPALISYGREWLENYVAVYPWV